MNANPLILFLGNPLMTDDRIGLALGRMLRRQLEDEGYEVEILERTGFSLMDHLEGREDVVVVDSVKTGTHNVGEIVHLTADDFQDHASFTPHYVGVPETLRLLKQLGLGPPKNLQLLGIEVADPYTISEKMTNELDSKLARIAERLLNEIRGISSRYHP